MATRYRQEVFNVVLAQLLEERGVISAPESIIKLDSMRRRRIPDVIVSFHGLRTAIEGEVSDQPDARSRALQSARKRVVEGIAHIGVAVVYPEYLRKAAFRDLKPKLAGSALDIAVVTESHEAEFATGDLDYLENALRQSFDQLVQEDIVGQAVAVLNAAIEGFAGTIVTKPGVVARIAEDLGIRELEKNTDTSEGEFGATRDLAAESENAMSVSRISGLVLVNAMIFQEILGETNRRVLSLQEALKKDNLQRAFSTHWQFILDRINYYPIFHLACEVLLDLTSSHYVFKAFRGLADAAQRIVDMRASLRHDLMGRVYHRLLADAKYLGTYYTSIPAAVLLLKLALRPGAWPTDWDELERVRQFRVVDLACGTGTLLMAAADSVTDNYVSACASKGRDIDHNALQNLLVEDVLYGYDVLASALHLTASTLSLRAPHITFTRMRLFSLPLGGPDLRLGSIEYLRGNATQMALDLFGATDESRQLTGESEKSIPFAAVPRTDLCVMNPPFTRSVGGNLLFGSVPEDERRLMQEELKKLVKKLNVPASITAGLGSVFVAAAHDYIKRDGRIALVLPKAVLSGVAWDRTRELFRRSYRLEYLVASHDPQRWNFSESTDLSEVLLVATKVGNNDPEPSGNVVAVNLWRNPSAVFESLAISHALRQDTPPDVAEGQGALEVSIGKEKVAETLAIPWNNLRSRFSWMLPCAFAQSDLIRAAYHLAEGNLWLPGYGEVGQVPLCPLGHLGDLGPDVRDIHDGFRSGKSATAFPAFWSHDAKAVFTLAQNPNAYLSPLPRAKKGRPLRKAKDLWPRSGRVLIAERLWLNTQSLVAVRLTRPVLSNVWWPFSLKKRSAVRHEKALTLWLNSTLGLLLMFLHREETRGAWVKFKKPVLAALPVLNPGSLSRDQLKALASAYDRLSTEPLQPLPNMNSDAVRAEIDKLFARVLGLPDFSILREMLAREPIICLRRL